MHVSAALALARAAAAGGVHKLRAQARSRGRRWRAGAQAARRPRQPTSQRRIEIATLDGHLDLRSLSRPLEDIVTDAYGWGIVDLHVKPPILTIGPPERPVASPLARLQARTSDVVTTLLHVPVRIADANALRLLPLVDGTRNRAELASAVKHIAVDIDWSRAGISSISRSRNSRDLAC